MNSAIPGVQPPFFALVADRYGLARAGAALPLALVRVFCEVVDVCAVVGDGYTGKDGNCGAAIRATLIPADLRGARARAEADSETPFHDPGTVLARITAASGLALTPDLHSALRAIVEACAVVGDDFAEPGHFGDGIYSAGDTIRSVYGDA
ncbi:hypothetical protein ACSFA0_25090 [Variovorax sp. LT1P1]|uniref:hypothetical protein n=1 Tax=Variovorax sp. LT1P1 TaxID=3443730 RepID=UPI003F459C31